MDVRIPETEIARARGRKRIVLAGLVVTLVGAAGLVLSRPVGAPVDKEGVVLATVTRGPMNVEVQAPGSLIPKESRWLVAETSGRVNAIRKQPGDVVEPETIVVSLRSSELRELQLAAESAAAAAQAEFVAKKTNLHDAALNERAVLAQLRADRELARSRVEAESKLIAVGLASKLQFEESKLRARLLDERVLIEEQRSEAMTANHGAQLAADRARLSQLVAASRVRKEQVEALDTRAQISGVVQQITVELGQQVAAGAKLARIAQPSELIARLNVLETQARDLRLAQAVRVIIGSSAVKGRVIRIDPAVQGGTVQVDVGFAEPLPADARLDRSVNAVIEVYSAPNVLQVRRPANIEPLHSAAVFRLDGSTDIAKRVSAQFGRGSEVDVEVIQGLIEGDRVIVSDMSSMARFDSIRLR